MGDLPPGGRGKGWKGEEGEGRAWAGWRGRVRPSTPEVLTFMALSAIFVMRCACAKRQLTWVWDFLNVIHLV